MNAISLTQPWATLLGLGIRRIETRPYAAQRGLLAIHAEAILPQWAIDRSTQEPLRTLLRDAGVRHWIDLPTGAIIAVGHVDSCQLITEPPDDLEATYDNFRPGYFVWRLSNMYQLPEPVFTKGGWGVWEWDAPSELAEVLIERIWTFDIMNRARHGLSQITHLSS
jgi:activating signal cointegrator 1